MARRNPEDPPKLHRFKPGVSGNPKGRPKDDPLLRKVKKLTANELEEIVNLLIKGSVQQLKLEAKNEKRTVIQSMVISVAVRIMQRGDMQAFDKLMDRLIGKVKEKVEHSGSIDGIDKPQIVFMMPKNGREANEEEG